MIPLPYYTAFYINLILVITLLIWVQTNQYQDKEISVTGKNQIIAFLLLIFTIYYIGSRPISGYYFGDTATYAKIFKEFATGKKISSDKEVLFNTFMKICAQVMNINQFFTLCAMLYVVPLYIACRRWFSAYHPLAFIMLLGAFSFWSYGTNGIRNGIASSLVILAMSYGDRKGMSILLLVMASSFHTAVMLPVLGFVLTYFVLNSKYFLGGWLVSIPLSLALGSFWENFFAGLGFADTRLSSYLLSNENAYQFRHTGFRYDFLLYSAIPVLFGYLYVYKYNFREKLYLQIFNTYLFVNAFWILVIRANFSNRFAYLSWFLIPIVLIYPILRQNIWKKQYSKIGLMIFLHFLFTYFMFLIK